MRHKPGSKIKLNWTQNVCRRLHRFEFKNNMKYYQCKVCFGVFKSKRLLKSHRH